MAIIDGIDMEQILQRERSLDFFLNVTIPAAIKRHEPFPHTLIICEYPRLAKAIGAYIFSHIPSVLLTRYDTSIVTPGDIAATLTNLQDNAVLFLENGASLNRMQTTALDVLCDAVKSGHIEIKIGRGPVSQTHNLELPPFSFIAIVAKAGPITSAFKRSFENTVNLSTTSSRDFCILEINATAVENSMHFDQAAIDEIVCAANSNWRTAARLVHWIRDYMVVHDDHFATIPKEYVKKVLSLL